MSRRLAIPLLAAAVALSGCKTLSFLAYALWPGSRERNVEAEYGGLADSTVAVVVYCDQGVLYEYPHVRLAISSVVTEQLRQNVKGIRPIDPRRIAKYQDEDIYWDEMDKTALGKSFAADRVLFISLVHYSSREPGSLNLYRGRITAQAAVYDAALPERKAKVWNWDNIKVVYPEHDPTGQMRDSDAAIRFRTQQIFAEMLAKKFYDHKVPIE